MLFIGTQFSILYTFMWNTLCLLPARQKFEKNVFGHTGPGVANRPSSGACCVGQGHGQSGARRRGEPNVCVLLLQDLVQSCARGGRRRVEDMCYERRRAEACVDESAHHALVNAGGREIV